MPIDEKQQLLLYTTCSFFYPSVYLLSINQSISLVLLRTYYPVEFLRRSQVRFNYVDYDNDYAVDDYDDDSDDDGDDDDDDDIHD